MITDIWTGDVALIEISDAGHTEAPPPVLAELARRGYLTLAGGKPTLTSEGANRAASLKPREMNLRAMFTPANGNRATLTTTGGTGLRIGGGAAHIKPRT